MQNPDFKAQVGLNLCDEIKQGKHGQNCLKIPNLPLKSDPKITIN
jgi:hypothetical protein